MQDDARPLDLAKRLAQAGVITHLLQLDMPDPVDDEAVFVLEERLLAALCDAVSGHVFRIDHLEYGFQFDAEADVAFGDTDALAGALSDSVLADMPGGGLSVTPCPEVDAAAAVDDVALLLVRRLSDAAVKAAGVEAHSVLDAQFAVGAAAMAADAIATEVERVAARLPDLMASRTDAAAAADGPPGWADALEARLAQTLAEQGATVSALSDKLAPSEAEMSMAQRLDVRIDALDERLDAIAKALNGHGAPAEHRDLAEVSKRLAALEATIAGQSSAVAALSRPQPSADLLARELGQAALAGLRQLIPHNHATGAEAARGGPSMDGHADEKAERSDDASATENADPAAQKQAVSDTQLQIADQDLDLDVVAMQADLADATQGEAEGVDVLEAPTTAKTATADERDCTDAPAAVVTLETPEDLEILAEGDEPDAFREVATDMQNAKAETETAIGADARSEAQEAETETAELDPPLPANVVLTVAADVADLPGLAEKLRHVAPQTDLRSALSDLRDRLDHLLALMPGEDAAPTGEESLPPQAVNEG